MNPLGCALGNRSWIPTDHFRICSGIRRYDSSCISFGSRFREDSGCWGSPYWSYPDNIRYGQGLGEGVDDSSDRVDDRRSGRHVSPVSVREMNGMPPPLCAVCGQIPATHVCQNCGKPTCSNCIDLSSWTCYECSRKTTAGQGEVGYSQQFQFSLASILFFVAFAAIFVGILLITLGSIPHLGTSSAGAVILIGPIPIILGTGPYSFPLIALSVGVTIVAIVFFFVLRRRVL